MLSDGPEPENTFAEPDFTAGSGTEEDPFVLAPVGPLQPGSIESTVEEITITNMGDIRVDMFDYNDEENYGRFTMYESAFSMEGSRQLPVGKDGEMVINFKFDDVNSQPTKAAPTPVASSWARPACTSLGSQHHGRR